MPRVVILSASYGSGHNVAARALAAAFEAEGAEAIVVDHFRQLVHPLFDRLSRAAYYWSLRRVPTLWGLAYGLGDRLASDSMLTLGVTRLGAGKLRQLLARLAPDAVVTVHATPATVLSALARDMPVPAHTTVVTDFVAHSQWIAPGIDRYCVAAEEVRGELVARGIASERVVVTGVPVRPEFEAAVDPAAARAALGLAPHAPVVLAMAGSHGAFGRLPDVARALEAVRRPLQGVIVAGLDRPLEERLHRISQGSTLRVLGFAPDIRKLMAAADLLVTKAGGMTLAEAMAAELPLLFYGSLPGQERRNERFAARVGVALVARSRRELRRLLARALDRPDLVEDLRARIRRMRQPEAARRIVAEVLGARRPGWA